MSEASSAEVYMLELINSLRASLGLQALRLEQDLNTSAERHTTWMFETGRFSHVGVNGSSEIDRMKDAGFKFEGESRGAENLAIVPNVRGESMEQSVRMLHEALIDSPSHYATMTNPNFEVIGIGIVADRFSFQGTSAAAVGVTQNYAQSEARLDFDPANNTIKFGTAFDDVLRGGGRSDAFSGFDGDDLLVGRGGKDRLKGHDGDDILRGGAGDDKLWGNTGADRLVGGSGNDRLVGGSGKDNLLGGAGNDRLAGNGGNDRLSGSKGNDVLIGNGGKDRLEGGAGNDTLKGGSGGDTFVFSKGHDRDTITDFASGSDHIDLTGMDFRNLDDAMRWAEQSGSAVVFDFGLGDILTVKGTTLAAISDDLLI